MYLQHFHLRELPFGLTPDTAFACATRSHREALNTLLMAAHSGEGFIKISGEVGTGKTLLCRLFLAMLTRPGSGADFMACYLPDPKLSPRTLMVALAAELGLQVRANAIEFDVDRVVRERLLQLARAGKRVVLCIDEAQTLPVRSLEALRLLSNLETEKRKLVQLVLFGQPELDATLALSALRQLRQRIAFSYRLGGMDGPELAGYLRRRLVVAGHRNGLLFGDTAVTALQRGSGGTPRLVNILAHKAMLCAYGRGDLRIERRHVQAARSDTESCARWPLRWLIR